MVSIIVIIFLFSFPTIVLSQPNFNFTKVDLPSTSVGPESITFDSKYGEEPYYTGISDGRIIKYDGANGFVDYAFTVPNRSKEECDGIGINRPDLGPTCGRPMGIGFNLNTKQLYVADAYKGFLVVGPNGGLATTIASAVEGVPFKLPTGLDVDQSNGVVYFTDASSQYSQSQIQVAIDAGDATGRLLKYDPNTQQVTVLLKDLSGAGGTSVSTDGSFVLVSEFIAQRIQKFWLTGPKALTSEVLITFQGRPVNIKKTLLGDFWVAVNMKSNTTTNGSSSATATLNMVPIGIKINATGNILRTVVLTEFYGNVNITDFQQRNRQFYVGSLWTDFLGRLSI
ncbi:protein STRICTOSIDINE SYNTHASE-LIKE 12-like [Humulus lupulus]|uniref:protein STRICTOSIDINE SYNTHASE-LIKE 12-like n=1 Tax=Humulus lupulus TaxID=3486 RepID=UPI002B415283|nr:protein STRICTOSIDINE SYNTHASE-LIKE 12-like [Humulus lupulus]